MSLHKNYAFFFLWFILSGAASLVYCQPVQISGIINNYHQVFEADDCNNRLKLDSVNFLFPGDRVLIIQMQGAIISKNNNSSFGDIVNYANSGNYEINVIDSITGTWVKLRNKFSRKFDDWGRTQVIKIPEYKSAVVNGTLTCRNWTGGKGGVLILQVSDSLILDQNIDVSGRGFRGGEVYNGGCVINIGGYTGYATTIASTEGGKKGEGIAEFEVPIEAARGKMANGGGGGNDHNSGGAGGGNFGSGGMGGERIKSIFSCPGPSPGIGGIDLDYSLASGKIFMGGGGGAGHGNNNLMTAGQNGGGIVIILGGRIIGNGNLIMADGRNAGQSRGDGAGGGGAGGTVLLSVSAISGNLKVSARGGKGGNADNYNSTDCPGPGGGGAGGALLLNLSSLPSNIDTLLSGGQSGLTVNGVGPCLNSSNNATEGNHGGIVLGWTVPEPNLPFRYFVVKTGNDTIICRGESIQLSATQTLNYSWNPPLYLDNPNVRTPVSTPDSTIVYVVTADDGCTSSKDTIKIEVTQVPPLNVAGDTLICEGNSVNLSASGGNTYIWTPQTGLNNPNISNPVAKPLVTTVYTVKSLVGSCFASNKVKIEVTPSLPPKVYSVYSICRGQSILLNSPGGSFYTWTPDSFLSNPAIANPIANPQATTLYRVDVVKGACSKTDSFLVRVGPPINSTVSLDTTVCSGQSVQLLATGGNYYQWFPNTKINNIFISNPIVTPDSSITYSVFIKDSFCSVIETVTIHVLPSPQAEVRRDTSICRGDTVQLWAKGGSFYQWSPASLVSNPSDSITFSMPVKESKFIVKVTDTSGCSVFDTVLVKVVFGCYPSELLIPNVFTPDNDGVNDYFRVAGRELKVFSVVIFNRWGERLFQSEDPDFTWDGKYNNVALPDGTYYYFINALGYDNQSYRRSGTVFLIGR